MATNGLRQMGVTDGKPVPAASDAASGDRQGRTSTQGDGQHRGRRRRRRQRGSRPKQSELPAKVVARAAEGKPALARPSAADFQASRTLSNSSSPWTQETCSAYQADIEAS